MKKAVIALDGRIDPKALERDDIKKIIGRIRENGYLLDIVEDDGLFCDGDSERMAVMKIETQGPGWVRHSEEYLKKIEDADILMIHFNAVGEQLLKRAKQLKYIAVMRSGLENVDVNLCTKQNICISNAPGRVAEPVADMAVAMMLDLVRGITVLNKNWKPGDGFQTLGLRKLMKDNVIGLVGFGIIGKMVAKKLSGFECRILVYDPFLKQEEAKQFGVEIVSLDEIMSQADIVSVHARLLPETENLIGEHEIALMKPDAFFVNTARAGLVDEEALIQALMKKHIQGAALDVFKEEPLPDNHILRQLDNVILTHHMSGGAGDGIKTMFEIAVDEVIRYIEGKPLQHQINR